MQWRFNLAKPSGRNFVINRFLCCMVRHGNLCAGSKVNLGAIFDSLICIFSIFGRNDIYGVQHIARGHFKILNVNVGNLAST